MQEREKSSTDELHTRVRTWKPLSPPRKVVCRHKKGTWEWRNEKGQGRREGGSREGKVPCALHQEFLILVHEYLGSERPVSFEYRLLRDLVYKEAMCEGSSGNELPYTAKAVPWKDYFTQVEDPAAKHCSKEGPHYRLGAKREQESCHLTSDNQLFFTSWVSLVIPTWAVLHSLANARKCQLEDFLWEEMRNPRVLYQKHGGACTKY